MLRITTISRKNDNKRHCISRQVNDGLIERGKEGYSVYELEGKNKGARNCKKKERREDLHNHEISLATKNTKWTILGMYNCMLISNGVFGPTRPWI